MDRLMNAPAWMRPMLIVAGMYNLVWGTIATLFPVETFRWLGMAPPNYPELWQCIGMIVGVYGIGYIVAARDPYRHWPIVLVGLAGKVLGPIGFLQSYAAGRLPLAFGLHNLTNDLIWWIPFTLVLIGAYRAHAADRHASG